MVFCRLAITNVCWQWRTVRGRGSESPRAALPKGAALSKGAAQKFSDEWVLLQ